LLLAALFQMSCHSSWQNLETRDISSQAGSFMLVTVRSRAALGRLITKQLQLRSLGEHCKLPKRGLGQSPIQKRIWCTLDLSESNHFTVDRSKFYTRPQLKGCSDTPSPPPPLRTHEFGAALKPEIAEY